MRKKRSTREFTRCKPLIIDGRQATINGAAILYRYKRGEPDPGPAIAKALEDLQGRPLKNGSKQRV